MPLLGKGMLLTFTDVSARDERDYNEWYNREHIDDRVNLPGFHRGRRYAAVRGTPRYLAVYECDTVAILGTQNYLRTLDNQTPWSQRVMARFTHFTRLTLRIQVDQTHGVGAALATVRFVPDLHRRNALVEWLSTQALPKLIARPGVLGAAAGENDLEVMHAPLQDKSMDHPRADESEWVVLLEGADVAAVGAAARSLFTIARLRPFGVETAPSIGTYRFLFGNQR
ncbi:DUF4286 family protein [uncultured Reyranella sp.]|uniref:DUF4286 family protein n=1 Tax=uncultured Reyranella sp. TaxID=735512 RepID=UPI0025DF3E27|nr:DUF4286 family protein [uncultured Reyranella sp.]